jgi:hypothetical protein
MLYWVKDGDHTPNMILPKEFDCALGNFITSQDLDPCHKTGDLERKAMEKEKSKK